MPSQHIQRPVLVLALEMPAATAHGQRGAFDALAGIVRRVRSYQVAATWAVPFGANLAQIADTLQIDTAGGNEMAWAARGDWAGPNISRGRFAVALAERFAAALEADLAISTLVAGPSMTAHLDLAAKYGIRAIVGAVAGRSAAPQPRRLRFGIWSVDAAASLSSSGTWWTSAARRAEREINRAIRTAALCCIHADLSRPETAAVLDRVLAHVARRRVEGQLVVETVGQLAARLNRPKVAVRPARSILRAA